MQTLRPILRPLLILRPAILPTTHRCYSTVEPLVKVTSIPAPHAGSVKVLSLNRPSARNAISRALLVELSREVQNIHDEGEQGPTRVMILASEVDGCFCAGADLKERATFTKEDTTAFLAKLRSTLSQMQDLPIPTIAAIAAPAFGGGLEIALPLDLRVLSSNATLSLPETRLGIIPGAGGTFRLPPLVGVARAMDMVLTGRRVTGTEAYFWGLADRLVQVTPDEEEKEKSVSRKRVLDVAVQLARDIAEGAPLAVRAGKAAVEEGWEEDGREGEAEERWYERVVGTRDRDEALVAFREKRKPMFKGY